MNVQIADLAASPSPSSARLPSRSSTSSSQAGSDAGGFETILAGLSIVQAQIPPSQPAGQNGQSQQPETSTAAVADAPIRTAPGQALTQLAGQAARQATEGTGQATVEAPAVATQQAGIETAGSTQVQTVQAVAAAPASVGTAPSRSSGMQGVPEGNSQGVQPSVQGSASQVGAASTLTLPAASPPQISGAEQTAQPIPAVNAQVPHSEKTAGATLSGAEPNGSEIPQANLDATPEVEREGSWPRVETDAQGAATQGVKAQGTETEEMAIDAPAVVQDAALETALTSSDAAESATMANRVNRIADAPERRAESTPFAQSGTAVAAEDGSSSHSAVAPAESMAPRDLDSAREVETVKTPKDTSVRADDQSEPPIANDAGRAGVTAVRVNGAVATAHEEAGSVDKTAQERVADQPETKTASVAGRFSRSQQESPQSNSEGSDADRPGIDAGRSKAPAPESTVHGRFQPEPVADQTVVAKAVTPEAQGGGVTPELRLTSQAAQAASIPASTPVSNSQAATPETPASRANPFERAGLDDLMPSIFRKAETLVGKNGHSEMRLQLVPEDLGRVSVKIAITDGVVTAKFGVESGAVKQLVEAKLPELKQTLESLGLRPDSLSVGYQAAGQDSSQAGFGYHDGNAQQRQARAFAAYGGGDAGVDSVGPSESIASRIATSVGRGTLVDTLA